MVYTKLSENLAPDLLTISEALLGKLDPIVRDLVTCEGLASTIADRVLERIKGANDISHGERRRKFWARVGFSLTNEEKGALDNRHPMSHQGFVTKGGNSAALTALGEDVRVARTLVNRVIFTLLEYDGPIFDVVRGVNVIVR